MAATSILTHGLDYLALKPNTTPTTFSYEVPSTGQVLAGFPTQYEGERVWLGSEMALKDHEFIVVLSEEEKGQVQNALRHFQSLNVGPELISSKTFPLSEQLSERLRGISYDCYEGRGFGILRGISPDMFTEEENVLVFAGVSAHVGSIRGFQDVKRELVVCHVISQDTSPMAKGEKLRPAFTNGQVSFHTDIGDILALYAMDVSDTGGETLIVSSSKIYNEFAATRPDLLQELAKDWAFLLSQNLDTDGTPSITNIPGAHDKLVFQYSRLPVTGFRNEGPNPSLPPPTTARIEAMEIIEQLGWKYSFPLPRTRGDIAFINNLCLMHARNPFDVDANGGPMPSKRHLVKLLLRDSDLKWDLPDNLAWMSERIYGANRKDGSREEMWQVKTGSILDGKIWVGAGAQGNG